MADRLYDEHLTTLGKAGLTGGDGVAGNRAAPGYGGKARSGLKTLCRAAHSASRITMPTPSSTTVDREPKWAVRSSSRQRSQCGTRPGLPNKSSAVRSLPRIRQTSTSATIARSMPRVKCPAKNPQSSSKRTPMPAYRRRYGASHAAVAFGHVAQQLVDGADIVGEIRLPFVDGLCNVSHGQILAGEWTPDAPALSAMPCRRRSTTERQPCTATPSQQAHRLVGQQPEGLATDIDGTRTANRHVRFCSDLLDPDDSGSGHLDIGFIRNRVHIHAAGSTRCHIQGGNFATSDG